MPLAHLGKQCSGLLGRVHRGRLRRPDILADRAEMGVSLLPGAASLLIRAGRGHELSFSRAGGAAWHQLMFMSWDPSACQSLGQGGWSSAYRNVTGCAVLGD